MSDFSYRIPDKLLSRLQSDEASLSESLSSSDLPAATRSGRTLAERRLLGLLPDAVSTVEEVMRTASPKERLAAATLVLDKNPATRPEASTSEASSLHPDLASGLLSAMTAMASAFASLSARPAASQTARFARPTNPPEEHSMKDSPLPVANLPEPSPDAEMTAEGLKKKPSKPKVPPKAKAKKAPPKKASAKKPVAKGKKK